MSNGHEEQFAIKNSKKYINSIEEQLSKLREEVNTNSSSGESLNIGARVRTNIPGTIVIPTIKKDKPNEINNYYTGAPTYSISQNQTNINGNKAFAAVLIVSEILSLIILVTLVTFVAFYGLS